MSLVHDALGCTRIKRDDALLGVDVAHRVDLRFQGVDLYLSEGSRVPGHRVPSPFLYGRLQWRVIFLAEVLIVDIVRQKASGRWLKPCEPIVQLDGFLRRLHRSNDVSPVFAISLFQALCSCCWVVVPRPC